MLAGLDSGVESLTAHVCIGRRHGDRGDCFHYLWISCIEYGL